MPKKALLFALGVIIAGAGAFAAGLSLWSSASPTAFLFCLGLAVLAATFKVPVPGMTGTISPSVVPVLFAVGTMSWQETVVISALAGLTQCLWRPKRAPAKVQILFNGANFALSGGVAYSVSHRVAGSAPHMTLLAAAIVFQLVDTLTVATVLSLLQGESLRSIWRNCHLWSFPYILAGGAFAAVWVQSDLPASFGITVLCATAMYLMSTFYREIVERTGRVS